MSTTARRQSMHTIWKPPTPFAAVAAALLVLMSSMRAQSTSPDYCAAIRQLGDAVRAEMKAWGISGVAVALVDDQETVYAAGFGEAHKDSAFRCGSISKLFNAVAVMQLVEAGRLDLDAPIDRYGRGLLPVNPFTNGTPVTLRQLLCHRSGMIREAPIGGYFDDAEPGLGRTIESIGRCVLVNPPNTKTRYSNVGPSIAGRVVELASGMDFVEYQRRNVLGPLGMTNSDWQLRDLPRGRLVPAYMRVAQRRGGFRHKRAPVFDLGTIPAGNLFTTAEDLARFVSMLAADGRGAGGRILRAESLAQMFTPQLVEEPATYGLGFLVSRFREYKAVSHSGAVYGHSSSLVFLPGPKLGVVVLGNEDVANARIRRLANLALSLMLEAKLGRKPPAEPTPIQVPAGELARFAGDYESQSFWARLEVTNGCLAANISGQPTTLTPTAPLRFLANSRLDDNTPVNFRRDGRGHVTGFTVGVQDFTRVPANLSQLPDAWKQYVGSYGPDFIPLVVSARHGHLYAMTENMVDYRLTPLNRHVFVMPLGLYTDEHVVFLTDPLGKAHSANLANMILDRR